jgi:hypothetical protein
MSVVGEVTVSYPFTAVYRRLWAVSIYLGRLTTSENNVIKHGLLYFIITF